VKGYPTRGIVAAGKGAGKPAPFAVVAFAPLI
jgi:hypothetical protein